MPASGEVMDKYGQQWQDICSSWSPQAVHSEKQRSNQCVVVRQRGRAIIGSHRGKAEAGSQ
eukprot:2732317-Karenia_brevis.AAC.1